MLILTRRKGESLVIDNDIRVTVSDIRGESVKIAIDAPEEVDIVREELLDDQGQD